jgi:hypothetical protein
MAEPLPGAPDSYNQYLSLWCRADGDQLSGGFWSNNYFEEWIIRDSTITGYGATLFDIECTDASGNCTNFAYVFENNLIYGVAYAQYGDDRPPGAFYGSDATVQDYNDFSGIR